MGNTISRKEMNSRSTVGRGHIVSGQGHIVAETLNMTITQPQEEPRVQSVIEEDIPSGEVTDIHKVWNQLVKYYETEACWIDPFPWNHDQPQDLYTFYISLHFERYDRTGKIMNSKNVELNSLFDPVQEGARRPTRVLVRGDPGSGKTTMCRKLCSDWTMGVTTVQELPHGKILPVLFSLRRLPPTGNLETELMNFLKKFQPNKSGSSHTVKDTFRKLGENLVIILDGYDEVNNECKKKVKSILFDPNDAIFSYTSFLVTSRQTEEWEFLKLFHKHFYIDQLSEEKVTELVRKFYGRSQTDLNTFFYEHPASSLKELTPLVILMLCWISKEQKTDGFPSKEGVIAEFIFRLAERCNERERLGLSQQKIKDLLISLGFTFYISYNFTILAVTENTLRKFFPSDYEFLIRLGILKEVKVNDVQVIFEPLHKVLSDHLESSFQKYFQHSYKGFKNPQDEIENIYRVVRDFGFSGVICAIEVAEDKVQNQYLQFYENISDSENVSFFFQLRQRSVTIHKYDPYQSPINFDLFFSYWNSSLLRELTQCVAPNADNNDEIDTMISMTEKMPERQGHFRNCFEIRTTSLSFFNMCYKLLHWLHSKISADDCCFTIAKFVVEVFENIEINLQEIINAFVQFRKDICSAGPSESHSLSDSGEHFQNKHLLSALVVEGRRKEQRSLYDSKKINIIDNGITNIDSEFAYINVSIFFPHL